MNVKEAREKLNEIHQTMLERARNDLTNFQGRGCVQIVHQEGTTLFYESAFAVKYDEYWFIITEHHNSIFYHEDEVTVRQYKRVWGSEDRLPWEDDEG